MADLETIVRYCNRRLRIPEIEDFPGARNGLQIENSGRVRKVGAAVDAGLVPFQKAIEAGIDLLIVHHGIYWDPPTPITGRHYRKLKLALDHDLAVYSAHLPLDLHPEIGNNAIVARKLGLAKSGSFLEHTGEAIGLLTEGGLPREELSDRLRRQYPNRVREILKGPALPQKIAILTGSGTSAIEPMVAAGADTLITGELKQHCHNFAEENALNLFICGHYATETHGVEALAEEVALRFDITSEFISTDCWI